MAICIWNSFDEVNFESHVKKNLIHTFKKVYFFNGFWFVKDDPKTHNTRAVSVHDIEDGSQLQHTSWHWGRSSSAVPKK